LSIKGITHYTLFQGGARAEGLDDGSTVYQYTQLKKENGGIAGLPSVIYASIMQYITITQKMGYF
jgi:hypothetical protein